MAEGEKNVKVTSVQRVCTQCSRWETAVVINHDVASLNVTAT